MVDQKGFVAGFVALVGRPNVGKSTLLNRILGVKNLPGRGQLVLVDTPGLHRPSGRGRTRLNKFMVGEALAALEEVDAVVVLVECPSGADAKKLALRLASQAFELDAGNRYVVEELKRVKKP